MAVLRVALEPVDVSEDRLLRSRADDLEPVRGVRTFGVGHEGTHGHRVVAKPAFDALCGEGRLGAEGQAVVDALDGVGDGADQGFAIAGAAAEDDRVDRHAFRVRVVRGDVGHVRQRGGEPAVRMRPRIRPPEPGPARR